MKLVSINSAEFLDKRSDHRR